MEDISKPRRASSTCAWVNIIYGCNEHCTYCVVPGVRGVEQSRPMESIRQEMVELAAAGYREVRRKASSLVLVLEEGGAAWEENMGGMLISWSVGEFGVFSCGKNAIEVWRLVRCEVRSLGGSGASPTRCREEYPEPQERNTPSLFASCFSLLQAMLSLIRMKLQ